MADRAIDLLALPEGEPALLLDVGCGSGLSGECISNRGHHWIGCDISPSMLSIAANVSFFVFAYEIRMELKETSCYTIWDRDYLSEPVFSTVLLVFRLSNGYVTPTLKMKILCMLFCLVFRYLCRRRLNTFFMTLFNCLRAGGKYIYYSMKIYHI